LPIAVEPFLAASLSALMQRNRLLLLLAVLVLAGCGRAARNAADSRTYEVRGIVRGFAPDRSTIDVEHEDIHGFMPSMTMPFTPRDSKQIATLGLNDAIQFRLHVADSETFITDVKKIAPGDVHLPKGVVIPTPAEASAPTRLREGDVMPVFQLTSQTGEQLRLESYRGRPFVITFIFTRCPMPNFCPRMSNNFSHLQNSIKNGNGVLAQTRLVSVTIDPAYDTASVLKEYGEHAGADSTIWQFATGEAAEVDSLANAFAVYRQAEGGTINHGLTTALIDGRGNVARIWRGNTWTPAEVTAAIQALGGNAP
jgi:protein SCO1/2